MNNIQQKAKRRPTLSAPETISVLVSYDTLQKQDIETITLSEVQEKFATSRAGQIFKDFDISFAKCFKAFLAGHFQGDVEPLFKNGTIDGLTPEEIGRIEFAVTKKRRY